MAFWSKVEKAPEAPPPAASPPAPPAVDRQPHATPPTAAHEQRENEGRIPMAMMKREEVPASAGGSSDMLLGPGTEFDGRLTFSGTVRIDARFKGSIVTDDVLVVGEQARIDADLTCGTVIVYGEVNGNIRAKNGIELRHPAKVRGNLETPSLLLEKGVLFQGESRMQPQERSVAVRPLSSAPQPAQGAPAPASGP
jgi:cytoskeletal protein CcmA (bactofilin family)